MFGKSDKKKLDQPVSEEIPETAEIPMPWGTRRQTGLDILSPEPAADPEPLQLHTVTEFGAHVPVPDPATDGAVIQLENVAKVYATGSLSVRALNGISLRIEEGEYVAIMGPSGSGKSTLMHIIGCLDVLSEGSYLLAGEDVSQMDEVDLAQIRNRRIGFVFQQFNLLPSLTAWRNVELPMIYAGLSRDVRKAKAIEALRRVGLEDRLNHRPGELSGGQQQRVAVARALVGDPSLILADEPTGNLDSVATEDALGLFDELHEQGRTIVLITHELEVAQRARRIVRVRDGVVTSDSAAPAAGRHLAHAGAHESASAV
jgi:putative ABC transport system ATP-binding protein